MERTCWGKGGEEMEMVCDGRREGTVKACNEGRKGMEWMCDERTGRNGWDMG